MPRKFSGTDSQLSRSRCPLRQCSPRPVSGQRQYECRISDSGKGGRVSCYNYRKQVTANYHTFIWLIETPSRTTISFHFMPKRSNNKCQDGATTPCRVQVEKYPDGSTDKRNRDPLSQSIYVRPEKGYVNELDKVCSLIKAK